MIAKNLCHFKQGLKNEIELFGSSILFLMQNIVQVLDVNLVLNQ